MTTANGTETIVAPNHFEKEFGSITDEQRKLVVEVLREFMNKIRDIQETPVSGQCSTCALNPKTDNWKGFIATAYGVLRSVLRVKPFFCHDNHPGRKDNVFVLSELQVCQGFRSVVMKDPLGARSAAQLAMSEIRRIVRV